ncbi:ww domain-containing oxidoreductase [Colletotrichum plurivorum]|uniref:Ww domain-containing oxidoreductase n=1 Tax=Colletotrichum plurivorum TaxID=2175906 RepID=A0A8H6N7R1_9PEZI|nr:ww domain-containing oxidoreductase [Colletotrichum plurivorum]
MSEAPHLVAPYDRDHEDPNGPGDARPTALKIVRDEGLDGKLQGKVFLVTGCTTGIGVETARALHATGADVFFTGRDARKGREVAERIAQDEKPGKVVFIEMHLDSLASVRAAADEFLRLTNRLNCLVCNAEGVGLHPKAKTKDGFEMHFGTNHLGHFALFDALKNTLLESATPEYPSRLVMVSSRSHLAGAPNLDDPELGLSLDKDRPYDAHTAYGVSKTANIWMANEVERRFGGRCLHATALNPGAVVSELGRHVGAEVVQRTFGPPKVARLVKSAVQGAATTVWAAVGREWRDRGGKYLGDVQDGVPAETCREGRTGAGFAAHAFDEGKERRLWEVSLKMIKRG